MELFGVHYFSNNLFPAGNYMFKVNNRNTRTGCEICSKLTIKKPERKKRMWGVGGMLFPRGGCGFYIKNKLKSSIFDDEKFIFLCHN